MHILICDDDAAFGTRMAEYVAAYFAARSYKMTLKNGVELSISRPGYAAIRSAYLEWKGQYVDE